MYERRRGGISRSDSKDPDAGLISALGDEEALVFCGESPTVNGGPVTVPGEPEGCAIRGARADGDSGSFFCGEVGCEMGFSRRCERCESGSIV